MQNRYDFTDHLLELTDQQLAISSEIRKTIHRHQDDIRLGVRLAFERKQDTGNVGPVGDRDKLDGLEPEAV